MKQRTALIGILLVIYISACAPTPEKGGIMNDVDTRKILQKYFGNSITRSIRNTTIEISYCPDNTCDSWKFPQDLEDWKIYDFIYIYFYSISDYNYPEILKFRESQPMATLQEILKRNSGKCQNDDLNEEIRCTLTHMKNNYDVSITFVRYDERKKIEVPQNFEEILKRLR